MSLEPSYSIFLQQHVSTNSVTLHRLKESEIMAWLSSHQARKDRDGPLWSPAKLAAPYRKSENAISVSWLVLDFDGVPEPGHFMETWRGMGLTFVCHSTYRNTDDEPRWRACFPLEKPVSAKEWPEWWKRASEWLGGGEVDTQCSDVARAYYKPCCPLDGPRWSERNDGRRLRPGEVPQTEPEAPATPERGQRPGDDFEARASWSDILVPHGWTPSTRKWKGYATWTHPLASHPLSARTGCGTSGKDRLWAFSPHLGVPPGMLLTKFGAYAHLNHGGDMPAAARALAAKGYGERPQRGRPLEPRRALPPKTGSLGEALPEIFVSDRQTRDVSTDGWVALTAANDPPRLFARSGEIAEVRTPECGKPIIKTVDYRDLRSRLARVADWRKETARGAIRSVDVPEVIAADIHSHYAPYRDLPTLIGVSPCPLLCPDGSLASGPGYDRATRWYIDCEPFAPAEESGADAAKLFLTAFLGNFPFVDDASKATVMALALLPYLRAYIAGPTPLHLFEAPAIGTGKTLALEMALAPGLGKIKLQPIARDDEEMSKVLLAELREGADAIVFDNVRGHVSSAPLELALSTEGYRGRILGTTATGSFDNRAVWAMSANNATLSPDLVRRTILCRLDAKMEDPGSRDTAGFQIKAIREYAGKPENRQLLSGWLLAMITEWTKRGMPRGRVTLGGFEGWARAVSGILEACGIESLDLNRKELRDNADTETENWKAFIEAWYEAFGGDAVSAKELIERLSENEALSAILSGAKDSGRTNALGMRLAKRHDAIYAGRRIEKANRSGSAGKRGFRLV